MSSAELPPQVPSTTAFPPWAQLISNYDRGVISSSELQSKLFEHVQEKTPDDYEAVVKFLRSHGDEFMRTTFAEGFVRLVDSARKVIDYSVEVLPLEERIGCRVEVGGGYTAAYESNQPWLAGRKYHVGRLFGDVKVDDHLYPVAVVRLDELLELSSFVPPRRGRFLLLAPRYKDHSWSQSEGVVHVYLFDSPPRDTLWWHNRDQYEIESHATFVFCSDEGRSCRE